MLLNSQKLETTSSLVSPPDSTNYIRCRGNQSAEFEGAEQKAAPQRNIQTNVEETPKNEEVSICFH